ncbi:MAG: hypothetical protein JNK90_29045 [Planctomycetaceae bacterium]|nr:hypothetical protein [Planctomycetaceae bacterium]MBN8603445.1 hypothetical protein [Planctomycetota bacterium]
MPKVFCLIGLGVAALILVIFIADLLFGLIGMKNLAPFYMASMLMDIMFIISAGVLAFLSWSTYKEQK